MLNKFYKILLIMLFIIVTLFSFTISSFASFDYTYDDEIVNIPDLPNDLLHSNYFIFIYKNPHGDDLLINLYCFDGRCAIYKDYDGKLVINFIDFSDSSEYSIYSLYGDSFYPYDLHNKFSSNTFYNSSVADTYRIISSNVDIYDSVSCDNVLFQATPVQNNNQGIILEGVEQIPQVIAEVIQKIIPIGLIVLSAILLIYLVRYVVYRML